MAYRPQNLKPLAEGAGGFALWHYLTDEAWTVLLEPGYFAGAGAVLPGNWIFYTAADALGRPATGILLVFEQGRCGTLLCAEQRPPKVQALPDDSDVIVEEPTEEPAPPRKGRR